MKSHTSTATASQTSPALLGFWLYIMTDCLVFAGLFASFAVLRNQTAGNASGTEIFNLPFVFTETLILLASSLASGMALLSAHRQKRTQVLSWLGVTAVLGLSFLGMELSEFAQLAHEGHSWTHSAFLSSYFGLVGTHGLHIAIGLVWLTASALYLAKRGFSARFTERLTMFTLFWHFLDIVWICIFTVVYLTGVLS
jgi:cytochrome o ubiquinol oxidase subunit 3